MQRHPFPTRALVVALLSASARAEVPSPAETPCEVVTSGRTSTLVSLVVVAVGDEVPETYSPSVGNTPGMSWYVSQHYALKTDRDEATARRTLAYAELAYPQHVWIVGRTPPDQDRLRMPFVLGSTLERMLDAIETDAHWRPTDIGGGGITYWGLNTAYNYPSGTLKYHQRDLVLHENLHLLQMCCGSCSVPHRLLEGITYTASNHVYDERARRLTLAVFDKPTILSPTTSELEDIRAHPATFREVCSANSHITLFTTFLWSDPRRLLGWREWRDAMMWDGRGGRDLAVMEEIFGPLDGDIEAQWQSWLAARHASFRYRDWGWEQDADAVIAYGWPQAGPYSRTDVLLPPGEAPGDDPLRMDYPLQPASDLVGPVHRGDGEPVVGALLDFEGAGSPNALAGLGLGVQTERPTSDLAYLPLLVRGTGTLEIVGADLGLPTEAIPFPAELREAMRAGRDRVGLTVRIASDVLEVTLRARATDAPAPVVLVHQWPLDPEQRTRLLRSPGAVLARDGRPAITPYFDDARRATEDLDRPAAPNLWRFPGFEELERLYRARRRLGSATPPSLSALEQVLLSAVGADRATAERALEAHAARIAGVVQDVRDCATDEGERTAALAALGVRDL